jgi:hypothetical protein
MDRYQDKEILVRPSFWTAVFLFQTTLLHFYGTGKLLKILSITRLDELPVSG